jgi:hypothetical protein
VCLRNFRTQLADEPVSQVSKPNYGVCICMRLTFLLLNFFLYSLQLITFECELTQPNNIHVSGWMLLVCVDTHQ